MLTLKWCSKNTFCRRSHPNLVLLVMPRPYLVTFSFHTFIRWTLPEHFLCCALIVLGISISFFSLPTYAQPFSMFLKWNNILLIPEASIFFPSHLLGCQAGWKTVIHWFPFCRYLPPRVQHCARHRAARVSQRAWCQLAGSYILVRQKGCCFCLFIAYLLLTLLRVSVPSVLKPQGPEDLPFCWSFPD